MTHWSANAGCKNDPNPERWFGTIQRGRPATNSKAEGGLLDLQDICALCPVRKPCGEDAMAAEATLSGDTARHGFRAYMTPAQRATIHRLGGLRGRDPMQVVLGLKQAKKDSHGKIVHAKVPPIPEDGVEWNRAHTALARKLTRWLEENIKAGRYIPGDRKLCKLLGCSPERLHIVLDALLQSGTIIEHEPQRYVRSSN